jgi:hypothetical protein
VLPQLSAKDQGEEIVDAGLGVSMVEMEANKLAPRTEVLRKRIDTHAGLATASWVFKQSAKRI